MGTVVATEATSFGDIARRFRIAAGLTQEALARQSGLSVRGISDLERGVRTTPQRRTLALLSRALKLSTAQQAEFDMAARARPRHGAHCDRAGRHDSGLPVSITSFVGREIDLAHVGSLLCREDIRLVTLSGPGSVGKTRLAIHLAKTLTDDFAGGVTFVPLAMVRDPDLVLPSVVRALGLQVHGRLSPVASIAAALHGNHLLILDNFEHVVVAAPTLSDLLTACPALTILITSRSVLKFPANTFAPSLPLCCLTESRFQPSRS